MKNSIILGCLILSFACSDADTLGDEPPVEVSFPSNATYENSVGALLDLKCGYCHASPIPATAPNTIIPDLDLTVYATRVEDGQVIRGADSIGAWLSAGILDHDVEVFADGRVFPAEPINARAMPLNYGTPITASERDGLLAWAEAGLPLDESSDPPGGDIAAGSQLWGLCSGCHGASGEGFELDGRIWGPSLREERVTIAKIKSMYLWSQATSGNTTPLSDSDAADLRAYIHDLL